MNEQNINFQFFLESTQNYANSSELFYYQPHIDIDEMLTPEEVI